MFDIGWDELLLVALVALVVIGPKELPTVLRTLGAWVAKARNLAGEFRNHVDDMIREAGVDEMKNEFTAMADPSVSKEIEDNLMIGNPLQEPAKTETPPPSEETPVAKTPEPAVEPARNDAAE